jgi:hypothetical protein
LYEKEVKMMNYWRMARKDFLLTTKAPSANNPDKRYLFGAGCPPDYADGAFLLQGGGQMDESTKELGWYALAVTICTLIMLAVFGLVSKAHAQDYSNEQIASAIYRAEGGARTLHPYGILQHYRTTSPRQACLNTIAHARKDFRGGDFIAFLGSRYCPVGASNDPRGLNKNWVRNVKYFLEVQNG